MFGKKLFEISILWELVAEVGGDREEGRQECQDVEQERVRLSRGPHEEGIDVAAHRAAMGENNEIKSKFKF